MSRKKYLKFVCLFLLVLFLTISPLKAKSLASQLGEAQIYYQQGNYQKTLEILTNYPDQNLPLLQEYLGVCYQKIGLKIKALLAWKKAYNIYLEQDNLERATVCLISMAELYIDLGKPQQALSLIKQWKYPLPDYVNGIIGNAYLSAYDYGQAVNYYKKAINSNLNSQQSLANYNNLADSLNKLAQKYLQLSEFSTSATERNQLFEQYKNTKIEADKIESIAFEEAQNSLSFEGIKTEINHLENQPKPIIKSDKVIKKINNEINQLTDNPEKIQLLIRLSKLGKTDLLLEQAKEIANQTGDNLSLAVIYAELGHFYEREKDYQLALEYTQLAQLKIATFLNYNYLYQWQWQEARLLKAMGEEEQAKLAYFNSLDSINQIRPEIANAGNDVEFDFQQEISPIYKELVGLLLDNPTQENLAKALEIHDRLQLAELENLFREPCFYPENTQLEQWQKDNKIVIFIPIILSDSFQVIVSLPNQKYLYVKQEINRSELNDKIRQWQTDLTNVNGQRYLETGNFFYRLIFEPFAEKMAEIEPNLIVFFNEGLLRNVPMSSLYDSQTQQFLIEQYPLSFSLARNFLIANQQEELTSALAFGLSKPRPPINIPLPQVREEVELVANQLNIQGFIDESFTKDNLAKSLAENQPQLLHLATHGEFTGLIENSFIQSYDQVLSPRELEKLLILSRLNLLTLSACQTSIGNARSVLGLAGIAVRIGIPSVLGSLWSINDDITVDFVEDFYENYKNGVSTAVALRQAQIEQIKIQSHPFNWSPFILIGN